MLKLLGALLHHLTRTRPSDIQHCHSDGTPLDKLVGRLWPFLRHSSTGIRGAALEALGKIARAVTDAGLQPTLYGAIDAGLCHVFQGLLVEEAAELLPLLRALWLDFLMLAPPQALADLVRQRRLVSWFTLFLTPAGQPMDPEHMLGGGTSQLRRASSRRDPNRKPPVTMDVVGGPAQTINIDPAVVLSARLEGAHALGLLGARWQMQGLAAKEMYTLINQMLAPNSATKRLLAGAILTSWAVASRTELASPTAAGIHPRLCQTALETLEQIVGFAELNDLVAKMRQEATSLVMAYGNSGLDVDRIEALGDLATFSIDQATMLLEQSVPQWEAEINTRSGLDNRQVGVLALRATVKFLKEELERLRLSSNGALACAVTQLKVLPEKLKSVLQYLVESLKREEHLQLQERCATAMAFLLRQTAARTPCPNTKIVALLYGVLNKDTQACPVLGTPPATLADGIYTLHLMDLEEAAAVAAKKKRKGKQAAAADAEEADAMQDLTSTVEDDLMEDAEAESDAGAAESTEKVDKAVAARGARLVLQAMTREFGDELLNTLPSLLGAVGQPPAPDAQPSQPLSILSSLLPPSQIETPVALPLADAQKVIQAFAQLETLAPTLPASLRTRLLDAVPYLLTGVCAAEPVIRYKASQCLASLAALPECRESVGLLK